MKFLIPFLLTSFISASVYAEIIDDFEIGTQSVTATSSDSQDFSLLSGLDTSHVFGGERFMQVDGSMSVGAINASVDTSAGSLSYESFNPAFTSTPQFLLSHIPGSRIDTVDLTSFINHDYVLNIAEANLGAQGNNFDSSVSLSSPSGGVVSVPVSFVSSTTPYSISVPMSSFSSLDLSQAYNLTFKVVGLSSTADFSINSVEFVQTASVPEPSSIAAISFGILGLVARKRYMRRYQKNRK